MGAFLQDDFFDTKLLNRVKKEIEKKQLQKTIEEIDYLNKIQGYTLKKRDFTTESDDVPDFIKKLNNARRKNIQIPIKSKKK